MEFLFRVIPSVPLLLQLRHYLYIHAEPAEHKSPAVAAAPGHITLHDME